jgi:hypothetical protein
MNELEDIKLKALLQGMELNSPKPNFSVKVMNKIFEEQNALEKIRNEKILGKGFWIIMILFIVLLVAIYITSGAEASSGGQLQSVLPEINQGVSAGYNSVLGKLGSLPMAIGAIMAAFSLLIFLDRY